MIACSSCLQKRDLVTLPLGEGVAAPNPHKPAVPTTLQVLKRFDFEPGLMRSGVIATHSQGPPGTALLFVKGAPGMVKPLVRKEVLPADFDQVGHEYYHSHSLRRSFWSCTLSYDVQLACLLCMTCRATTHVAD